MAQIIQLIIDYTVGEQLIIISIISMFTILAGKILTFKKHLKWVFFGLQNCFSKYLLMSENRTSYHSLVFC